MTKKKEKPKQEASSPAYSIGVAARMSGVPLETVRIWERRYALLRPARTVGGHRMYSDDDVALLTAARTLVNAGQRPATIFTLPHKEILAKAQKKQAAAAASAWDEHIGAVIEAALALDEARVAALLDGPLVDHALDDVATALWLPVLARTGSLWEAGVLSIAVEHFIQQLVVARVHAALRATPGSAGPVALCACVPDERHEVGLFTAALALKRAGFVVVVFGGDLPAQELEAMAQQLKPALIVLSSTSTPSQQAKETLPAALARAPLSRTPLILGGYASAELSSLIERPHARLDSVLEVVSVARALTQSQSTATQTKERK